MSGIGIFQVHEAPGQLEYANGKAARRLLYAAVLLQEGHADMKRIIVADMPMAMSTPYEQRGVTSADIEKWIADCDPLAKPAWDPVACFRAKARAAMKPRPGLGSKLLAIGVVSFGAAFLLAKRAG